MFFSIRRRDSQGFVKWRKAGGSSTSSSSKTLWLSLLVFQRLHQKELHITIRNPSSFSQQQMWEKFIQQTLWCNKRAPAMELEKRGSNTNSASFCSTYQALFNPQAQVFPPQAITSASPYSYESFKKVMHGKLYKC